MTTNTIVKESSVSQKEVKGLSLVTIARELNCLHPSYQSTRKDLLIEEIKSRKVTNQNLLEWFKAFKIGGVKNKFSELRSFQVAILKKLAKFEPTSIFKKNIPLFNNYLKELKSSKRQNDMEDNLVNIQLASRFNFELLTKQETSAVLKNLNIQIFPSKNGDCYSVAINKNDLPHILEIIGNYDIIDSENNTLTKTDSVPLPYAIN